jgi:uncharacterized protein
VVEDCVNSVGVDLNTASYSLLSYVSGLNAGVAKNIVQRRKAAPFKARKELLEVPKLGAKAYEQCAGFLRIPESKNVLDNTGVHPESYGSAKALLHELGYTDHDIKKGHAADIAEKVAAAGGSEALAARLNIGLPTLLDIIRELLRPGRDPRDELPPPMLRTDVLKMEDLAPGMELKGTVRNVVDFGAFVDIGVHQDGLVHISQMSNRRIHHPLDAVSVGDVVKVRVLSVDAKKKRIALSMREC